MGTGYSPAPFNGDLAGMLYVHADGKSFSLDPVSTATLAEYEQIGASGASLILRVTDAGGDTGVSIIGGTAVHEKFRLIGRETEQELRIDDHANTPMIWATDTGGGAQLGFFGIAVGQQAHPVTLADVIALLTAYGLCPP